MTSSFNQILGIARNGIQSRMLDLDTISNNLANLQTTGYKSTRLNFQEMLNEKALNGVQSVSSRLSMQTGTIETTSSALDMAIEGSGFFSVKLPDGKVAYTRDGHFGQDAEGMVVNADGYPLVWTGTIPEDSEGIEVQADGSVKSRKGSEWTEIGKISLTTFANPSGLTTYGDNLMLESDVSGKGKIGTPDTTGFGQVHGYSLERSNVNLGSEMAHMIRVQRAFQTSVTAVKKTDEMISLAINLR